MAKSEKMYKCRPDCTCLLCAIEMSCAAFKLTGRPVRELFWEGLDRPDTDRREPKMKRKKKTRV